MGRASLMSREIESGFARLAGFGDDEPDCDSQTGAAERADDHDPEVAPCFGREQGGAEGTGGVDRAVVDRDSDDVHQAESYADGESGEFAESAFGISGGQHNEDEEEGKEHFGGDGHAGGCAGLKDVGGDSVDHSVVVGYSAEVIDAFESETRQPEEETGAESGSEKLGDDISAEVAAAETAFDPYGERYGGVDVASRYVADGITEAYQHETEAKTDTEAADRRAGQNGAAAGQQNKKHRADKFGDVFTHTAHK